MKILGVDPGTHRTGVGIIEAQGSRYQMVHFEVIQMRSSQPLAERLHRIFTALSGIFKAHAPAVLALENVFFGRDVSAMVKIGEARACAMLAAAEYGVPVVEYAPARVKQAVSGNGRATKEQMKFMVRQLLNLKEAPPADGADALAVALCHLHSRGVSPQQQGGHSWKSKKILDAFKGRIVATTRSH